MSHFDQSGRKYEADEENEHSDSEEKDESFDLSIPQVLRITVLLVVCVATIGYVVQCLEPGDKVVHQSEEDLLGKKKLLEDHDSYEYLRDMVVNPCPNISETNFTDASQALAHTHPGCDTQKHPPPPPAITEEPAYNPKPDGNRHFLQIIPVTKVIRVTVKGPTALRTCEEAAAAANQRRKECQGRVNGHRRCKPRPIRDTRGRIASEEKSLFFMHLARTAGTSFANTIISLVNRQCPDCLVLFDKNQRLVQNHGVATSRGEVQARVFKFSYRKHNRFSVISRSFHTVREIEDVEDVFKTTKFSAVMLRAPDKRLISQFKHDTLLNPASMRCANNLDDLAQCCNPGRGCPRGVCPVIEMPDVCLRYNNFLVASLLAKPWVPQALKVNREFVNTAANRLKHFTFIGLQEAYSTSVCLFLWHFRFDDEFARDCLGDKVDELPTIDALVREHNTPEHINGYQKQKGETALAEKGEFARFGQYATNLTRYDWRLYDGAALNFWNRVNTMYTSLGYEVKCVSAVEQGDEEEQGREEPPKLSPLQQFLAAQKRNESNTV